MLRKNLFFDERADSQLISWFQELAFKENPKCHETLNKAVRGSTCGWMAAPRCINILTFSLQSNLCLMRNGEPTSTQRSSRDPRWLQNLLKYLPKKRKSSVFQKVQVILRRPSLTLFLVFLSMKLYTQGFHLRLFWSITAYRGGLDCSQLCKDAAFYRQQPFPKALLSRVKPFS